MAWMDIDAIPELMKRSVWTSYNRLNWASFEERDHFGDPALPLRERVAADARAAGIALPDGPIFLLTHLRYLGYCFNPISFYFCYDGEGVVKNVLAEVNSTFGESRNYWLGPQNQLPGGNSLRYRCPKTMHVSPFMGMDLDYEFVLSIPGDRLVAHMNTLEGEAAPLLDATLSLERKPWSALTGALLRHPWMTAKVIAAIHWQALLLWMKRVPVFPHPRDLHPRDLKEAAK